MNGLTRMFASHEKMAIKCIVYTFQDSSNGLSNTSITISDGKIYCTFIRNAITKLILPDSASAAEVTIDLNSVAYFVELASGPLVSADQISRHKGASVTEKAVEFKKANLKKADENSISVLPPIPSTLIPTRSIVVSTVPTLSTSSNPSTQSTVSTLTSTVSTLTSTVSTLTSTVSTLASTVSTLNSTISTLTSTFTTKPEKSSATVIVYNSSTLFSLALVSILKFVL